MYVCACACTCVEVRRGCQIHPELRLQVASGCGDWGLNSTEDSSASSVLHFNCAFQGSCSSGQACAARALLTESQKLGTNTQGWRNNSVSGASACKRHWLQRPAPLPTTKKTRLHGTLTIPHPMRNFFLFNLAGLLWGHQPQNPCPLDPRSQ